MSISDGMRLVSRDGPAEAKAKAKANGSGRGNGDRDGRGRGRGHEQGAQSIEDVDFDDPLTEPKSNLQTSASPSLATAPKRDSAIAPDTKHPQAPSPSPSSSPSPPHPCPQSPFRSPAAPRLRPRPRSPSRLQSPPTPSSAYSSSPATTATRSSRSTRNAPSILRPSPSLPSIIVHDAPPSSSWSRRAPVFMRRISQSDRDDTDSDPVAASHQRLPSFHGIDLDIETGPGFDELNSPDKLQFSTRGSILLGSQKLQKMMQARDDAHDESDYHTAPNSPAFAHDTAALAGPLSPAPPMSPPLSTPASPSKKRLAAGPRTPSVHMLNAVLDGRRVLSAEEVTFSQKVRSMYEFGDENAADWTTPAPAVARDATPEPRDHSSSAVNNPRRRPATSQGATPVPASQRFSFIANEHERAGGIEDWEDLGAGDTDRYGFIKPRKVAATDGATPVPLAHRPSMQRVSTSLQLLSNSPRQRRGLMRGPSSAARSSRSLPPTRPSTRTTVGSPTGPSPSVYSFQSTNSAARVHNPFRSRDRRVLDEASDMLTLPAYLHDVSETDTHDDRFRRREWVREEKWRKMARLVSNEQGGGMAFDFDARDPKLVARTWKGIPDKWRATAWHAFLAASAKRRGDCQPDEQLIDTFHHLQEQSSADDVQIDVDVPRTISMHVMFRRRYRGGQRLLFRVLHAISIHFPSTGYVQGMAALAATLLCYYDEEHTFVMLVRMWELRGLKTLYESGFEGLMKALKEFENEWLASDRELKTKLDEFGIDGTSYGTRWYLTLFNLSIPFPAQLRVWDVFMLLGDTSFPGNPPLSDKDGFDGADLSVLHATSAALIDATKVIIHESDFENAMKVLTSWIPIKDEDMLMRVAKAEWKIHMKNRRRAAPP